MSNVEGFCTIINIIQLDVVLDQVFDRSPTVAMPNIEQTDLWVILEKEAFCLSVPPITRHFLGSRPHFIKAETGISYDYYVASKLIRDEVCIPNIINLNHVNISKQLGCTLGLATP